MNYIITPSIDPPQSDVSLRVATATFDVEGRNFLITTPWNTIFRHKLVIHSAFPGGPIDAYIEEPASDNDNGNVNGNQGGGGGRAEGEVKLVPKSVGMIYIKQSHAVPVGAKLVRVWGSEELWMLYFPPKPLVTGNNKTGAKTTRQTTSQAPSRKDLLVMQALLKENADLAVDPETHKKWGGPLDDAFFKAFAKDVGWGATGDDVRVHFANDIADPKYRRLHPQHNDAFWQKFWRVVTRDGKLSGTAGSHWSKGHDKHKVNQRSGLEEARMRRHKDRLGLGDVDDVGPIMEQYRTATLDHGIPGVASGDELRREGAMRICDERYRRRMPQHTDEAWEEMWQITTRGGTLAGVPKHWKNKT